MFVTSNPEFAFHDDVFPAFAKNAASQRPFYSTYGKTIIPNNSFSSLEELEHISTLELNFNKKEMIRFKLKVIQFVIFITEINYSAKKSQKNRNENNEL